MSWFTENKFLAGFGAVMLVGLGGVGFFTMSAKGKLNDAQSAYETAQADLNNLQNPEGNLPYPNQANQKAVEAQKAEVAEAISALFKQLSTTGFPQEDIDPSKFQIDLKKAIDDLTKKAETNGVALQKDKFNLGFDYLGQLPVESSTKSLGHELKAIQWVVNQVIEGKASEIKDVVRPEIDQEKGKPKTDDKDKDKDKEKKKDKESKRSVHRDTFTLTFVAEQKRARDIINKIVACKEQFMVPRRINIKNEKTEPPAIADASANAPGKDGDKKASILYVLGEEKIAVTMELEIVDFVQPASGK